MSEIHLFEGDYIPPAQRVPVARRALARRAAREAAQIAYFKALYSKMHRGIIDHEDYLHAGNIEQLRGMDFVFLCFDKGTSKKLIIARLRDFGVAFVDVGMGIYLTDDIAWGCAEDDDRHCGET